MAGDADVRSASSSCGPRIVDFSTHMSGPLAAHLLAEMGARVVKVENPRTGDGNRGLPPLIDGVGMMHLALNGGARSIAVDRRSAEWPRVVEAACRWADAVIVGARPVDARARGIDFATAAKANPRVVYCSVSGFGDQGPWSELPAHGQTIDGFAGLIELDRSGPVPRTTKGWRSTGTSLGGVFAALAVMGALYRRDHGIECAQYVSVSLWAAAMWWSWRDTTMIANAGERWPDYSDLGTRYAVYATADARMLMVAPIERRSWERFVEVAGLPAHMAAEGDWTATGMDFGAADASSAERRAIEQALAARTLDDWIAALSPAGIPFAPVITLEDALRSEHAQQAGVLRTTTAGTQSVQVPVSPIRFDGQAATDLAPAPALGEHGDEIRAELGLGEVEDDT